MAIMSPIARANQLNPHSPHTALASTIKLQIILKLLSIMLNMNQRTSLWGSLPTYYLLTHHKVWLKVLVILAYLWMSRFQILNLNWQNWTFYSISFWKFSMDSQSGSGSSLSFFLSCCGSVDCNVTNTKKNNINWSGFVSYTIYFASLTKLSLILLNCHKTKT